MFKTSLTRLRGLCLAVVLCVVAPAVLAQAPGDRPSRTHAISLMNGKIAFTLDRYVAQPDEINKGGVRYFGPWDERFISTSERVLASMSPDGKKVDLQAAGEIIKQEQQKEFELYQVRRETTDTLKGLDMRRIDAAFSMNGYNMLNTNLLMLDGAKLAVVRVISRGRDRDKHEAQVQRILGKS